jgi:23S rRNA (adenine-C8)-methyltransferase
MMEEVATRVQKIQQILSGSGEPKYRLEQVLRGVYVQGVRKYTDITSIPRSLARQLEGILGEVLTLKVVNIVQSSQAKKVLFETRDGQRLESVRMEYLPNEERKSGYYSLCLSSQSGCAMGCRFCATGAIGLRKNLAVDEIADQILYFRQNREELDSYTFMGMGEPFANPNLFAALAELTDPKVMAISPRRISISTIGTVPGIERLTREFPGVNLTFSLHSPYPAQREELVPASKIYPISQVMVALDQYIEVTNNKVLLAYVLLGGVNDTSRHARGVVDLIEGQKAKKGLYHVNLIRFHPGATKGDFREPSRESVLRFQKIVTDSGINCTVRQSFGLEIGAACGQLVAGYSEANGFDL